MPLAGQPTACAMFTVGNKVERGDGSWGLGPMPAVTGNCATSPHALSAIDMTVNSSERLGFILVPSACHLPAAFGAPAANLGAFVHIAYPPATNGAGFADFGANRAKTIREWRITELEIGRCLADFGAADHQAEMFRFNMLPAHFQALVHRRFQAKLMTVAASVYAGLHEIFRAHRIFRIHGVFGVNWLGHEILPR